MARTKEVTTIQQIVRVQGQIRGLELQRQRLIAAARDERVTWQAIADALGVSRQAAWESYARGRQVLAGIRERSDLDEDSARDLVAEALAEVRSGA